MTSTPLPPDTRTPYFPYIDGMRALAVLAVLIYHLHGPWLPGGFVGVDVFFVISGFVVSASIASFRGRGLLQFLAYFYARRIKRIFPALIVCLLVTAYATALFVPASWLSAVNQKTGQLVKRERAEYEKCDKEKSHNVAAGKGRGGEVTRPGIPFRN